MAGPVPPRMTASLATVRRQFDRRAANASRHEALWREVDARLQERLELIRHPVTRLLDLGCGSGASRTALLERFPQADWIGVDASLAMLRSGKIGTGWRDWLARLAARREVLPGRVCADAGQLPLPDGSIDLVFANLMVHWHPAPHELMREVARVLAPGGLLIFSSYGPDSIAPIRAAFGRHVTQAAPVPFVDMHDLGDMMIAAGFEAPVVESDRLSLSFANLKDMLRELQALGGNPRSDRFAALPGSVRSRQLIQELSESLSTGGRVELPFEIVIGHGWRRAVTARL